ncbi:PQQ-binding-like beta-propeller repeat protein [Streptomyces sp. NPDC127068]|uniref:serine/threonine-protein kinase n=1 Tax=Streptomyces sp. NPDC127068 TaxID=3347127 RepID=UPI00365A6987
MQLRGGDPEEIGGYPVEARLGSGGMGTVFLARTASGRPVAIKLIHQHFAGDEEFRIRFRQEVSAARRVSGVFTAAVVDADSEALRPWMATAYISGPTLAQRIADEGTLFGPELRTLAIGLAEALREIHRAGVIHRDLKPSNVVLSPDGPRVIDFGISRASGNQTLTMTGRVIGTPPFMSPEQLQTPRAVGPESDVFSLATLLVFAATGQGPFDADSPYMTAYQVVHEAPDLSAVPAVLREVVEPCLTKVAKGRPSAHELLVALRGLPEDLGSSSAPMAELKTLPGTRRSGVPGPPDGWDLGSVTDDTPGSTPGSLPGSAAGDDVSGPGAASGSGARSGRRRASRKRRRFLGAGVVTALVTALVVAGVVVLGSGGADRPEAGGGRETPARGQGVSGSAAPLPAGFAPWRKTVRGGQQLGDELRCVAAGGDDLFCGGGGVVAARLRASDGRVLWRTTYPGVPMQGLHLIGVTGGSGKGLAGRTVLGYHLPKAGSERTEVVALDAASGEELWRTRVGTKATYLLREPQHAVLTGSTVLTVDPGSTRFEARSARDGQLSWTTALPSGSWCAPFPAGGKAYAMCAPSTQVTLGRPAEVGFHTLDPNGGALGRAVTADGALRPVGALGGRLLLVREAAGAGETGFSQVVRLDMATGRREADRLRGYGGTVPGFADGTLYFTSPTGEVSAVDPGTGRRKWHTRTAAEWASAPLAAGGVLYVGSATGRVTALDARKGSELWSTSPHAQSPGGFTGSSPRLTLVGRVLVAAAADNTLSAFDLAQPPRIP